MSREVSFISSKDKSNQNKESLCDFEELNKEISKVLLTMNHLCSLKNSFPKPQIETQSPVNAHQTSFSSTSTTSSDSSQSKHQIKSHNPIKYYSSIKRKFTSEEKNKICLNKILSGKDNRTTIMIRHIPNKYTLSFFTEEINVMFKDKYDVIYLPIDYVNNCNLGFAFINFVNPLHIVLFYEMFIGKKWKRYQSEKRCDLVYAKIQGRDNLIKHFDKGAFLKKQSIDKKPLVLTIKDTLPNIVLPYKYMKLFMKYYPYKRYQIYFDCNLNAQYVIIDNY